METQYQSFLNHRDRLLSDIVADDFVEVMQSLRERVVEFCSKYPTFKERAAKDFKITFI